MIKHLCDEGLLDGNSRQIAAGANCGDAIYPADGVATETSKADRSVRCLTPQLLVRRHLGYRSLAKDWHNVRHLRERFRLPIPDSYKPFAEIPETR